LLAEDAVAEWRPFFAMVSLSVAHNGGANGKPGQMRVCYKADIVYGDMGRFSGDFLRHEVKGVNTRGFIYDLFMEKMCSILVWVICVQYLKLIQIFLWFFLLVAYGVEYVVKLGSASSNMTLVFHKSCNLIFFC
jgi:hypothetical protein